MGETMRLTHYACQAYAQGVMVGDGSGGNNPWMNRIQALGRTIKARRLSKNLTQTQLAENAGVGQESVSRVERGKQGISLDALVRISDALEAPVSALWVDAEGAATQGGAELSAAAKRPSSDVRDLQYESDQHTAALAELFRVVSQNVPNAGPALVAALEKFQAAERAKGQNAQVLGLVSAAAAGIVPQRSARVTPSASPRGSSKPRPKK